LDININLSFSLVQSIQGIVSNMDCASNFQSIEFFNNMDLVWRKDVQHGRARIIKVECAYIPHARVSKKLNGE
jgi:hypothetical protein